MFGLGSWRFLLAFFVAISHLWSDMIGGPAAYAVWGFFVLSGFLMTEILRHKYGFNLHGLQVYAFNRFLRIFPLYYVTLILGILTVLYIGNGIDLKTLNPQFYLPTNFYDWIANFSLLPFANVGGRPVPVSGALAVEVGVYILIPFMAHNKSAAWLGAFISLILNAKIGFDVESFPPRYSEFLTGYFAFAIGSLINHYKDELQVIARPKSSLIVWLLHCLVIGFINTWPWTYGLYISVLLSAWVVISLYQIKSTKIDIVLGDLSYPLYLLHTTVAAWFFITFDGQRTFLFFIISFIATTLLSYLLLIIFDHPIQQKFKKRIKLDLSHDISLEELMAKMINFFKIFFVNKKAKYLIAIFAVIIFINASWIGYKIITNDTLKVYNWGPQSTQINTVPNIQPDGNGGLWIVTSITKGLGKLKVYINDEEVRTEVAYKLVTASIPKRFFTQEKSLVITIKNDKGMRVVVGTLNIQKSVR